jgi:hypothetical protein
MALVANLSAHNHTIGFHLNFHGGAEVLPVDRRGRTPHRLRPPPGRRPVFYLKINN